MKNDFEIRGDIAVIFLNRESGDKVEAIIDLEDLPKVQKFEKAWCAFWKESTQSFYVRGNVRVEKNEHRKSGYSTIWLHHVILGVSNIKYGLCVDHINHDSLDNRKSNLRIVTVGENNINKKGRYRCNKSGFLGVYKEKNRNVWRAQLKYHKKIHFLGFHVQKEDAINAVIQKRHEWGLPI